MVAPKLDDFLCNNGVFYGRLNHPKTFSAEATAVSSSLAIEEMAKVVILEIDGRPAMAVVPAGAKVDLGRIKKISGAGSVELAKEQSFKDMFEDCETGAMPPFGNLYNMPEYVDVSLGNRDLISFNGGSHTELCQLPYLVFERLAHPIVARIAC